MRQTHENDIIRIYNPTNMPFKFRWNNVSYTVSERSTQDYPRFLAEHCAKHLADFILQFKEYQYKKEHGTVINLMRNKKEREKIINMVFLGVRTSFIPDSDGKVVNNELSTDDSGMDLGEIDNDMMGNVFDSLEIADPIEAVKVNEKSTKQEIAEQLTVMGIAFNANDSKEELIKKLKVV